MNAIEAIRQARAAGTRLGLDGDTLMLEAPAAPPPDVIDLLSRHKLDLLALLRPAGDGWSALDWLAFFDERTRMAAIYGLAPAEAAARAFASCVVEWLSRHPAQYAPGRCTWCGKAESFDAVVLPFGTEPGLHSWLHSRCWPAWHAARRDEAITALAAMGIDQTGTHR